MNTNELTIATYHADIDTPHLKLTDEIMAGALLLKPYQNSMLVDLSEYHWGSNIFAPEEINLKESLVKTYEKMFALDKDPDRFAWVVYKQTHPVGYCDAEIVIDYNDYLNRHIKAYIELDEQEYNKFPYAHNVLKTFVAYLFLETLIPTIYLSTPVSTVSQKDSINDVMGRSLEYKRAQATYSTITYTLNSPHTEAYEIPRHVPYIMNAYKEAKDEQ